MKSTYDPIRHRAVLAVQRLHHQYRQALTWAWQYPDHSSLNLDWARRSYDTLDEVVWVATGSGRTMDRRWTQVPAALPERVA